MRAVLLLGVLAACPARAPEPAAPVGTGSAPAPAPAVIDAAPASQEEQLAAIQQAMNQLDEAAQACWARAATERFDIEGEVVATIDIAATAAAATIAHDTTRNPKLTSCLTRLLGAYRWAPPLHGQTIQLPFKFRAPADGQNVIDRELVDWAKQGNVGIAVELDENNSGNGAASLYEVAIGQGTSTGLRKAERAELWYLRAAKPDETAALKVTVTSPSGTLAAGAGDMVFVPAGAVRDVTAQGADLRAVVAIVPGGREGTARSGALPTPPASPPLKPAPPAPVLVRAESVAQTGPAKIFLDATKLKTTPLAASLLTLPEGAQVAEHVHAKETELLFVLAGSGTMTVNGVALAVTPTSVIQIPANTKHAFTAAREVHALQIYTPAGPEQRFKKASK
ncbi:MAG TPA: cupin domain-containing protein [Kofleriaceae bacterium]|nr:cupin domain-containing protein [Kofleriaceae bacterium]